MDEKISHRVEEIILVLIIALNILDAFRLLKGDLDVLQKIISWAALGYILYKASFTKIIFGSRKRIADAAIIAAYFLFVMKDFTAYAAVAAEGSYFFNNVLSAMAANSAAFDNFGIYSGGILLIAVSLYAAFKLEIRKPSFMDVIEEDGKRSGIHEVTRAFIVLLVLSGFFVTIFNLLEGWLVFLLDSPIIIIGIAAYLFIVMRHYEKFSAEHLIFKAGDFGDKLYKGFVSLFHYKRGVFLGVGGLLALHLLTDFGNFVVPYIFGIKDEMFLAKLGAGHSSIFSLMMNDMGAVLLNNISVFIIYLLNIIAIVFFLLMPAFVWYKMFNKKELHVNRVVLGIICSSLVSFILMPLFSIRSIPQSIMMKEGITGADIMTRGITESSFLINKVLNHQLSVFIVAIISIIAGLTVYLLAINKGARKKVFVVCVLIGFGFFGYYIWFFFANMFNYYIQAITSLLLAHHFFISAYLLIFMMLTTIFYIAGYAMFVYEIVKEHILREFV
ncbi:MAG: hypothetical protein Q7J54_00360 [Candidatus Woesearchaeota archaeon]|nr:hypothetical protein [Candidatus Woesearchaeota archaeon]